jgi:hypothetical protein
MTSLFIDFCYGISKIFEKYLKVSNIFLISAINFYYIINKLIIMVSDVY